MVKKRIRMCVICKKEFNIRIPGRLKILRREKKGEKVIWICPECAGRVRIEEKK